MQTKDIAVLGGGIVGLATAWQLLMQRPQLSLVVLEKEKTLASHQTGHNSGVIHSGIYYKPGSLKAINCREGKVALEQFCDQHEIPWERCGKVIVAVNKRQLPQLEALGERALKNGVRCTRIGIERLHEREPHVQGVAALEVPETGIVDYVAVAQMLARQICDHGGIIKTDARVTSSRIDGRDTILETHGGEWQARVVVNCTGLHSDRVGHLLGTRPVARIVPFRGEYFTLRPDKAHLCRHLIYPVPDPRFPFLGVHFTRMMNGEVHCGPNAVLALAREGYHKTALNVRDMKESLLYPGFWKLAARHARTGIGEVWRSLSKGAFVRALQKLIPEIRASDLVASPPGIRAQALMPNGKLIDDFLIDETERVISVVNAPSPAATASLNIGRQIAEKALARLD